MIEAPFHPARGRTANGASAAGVTNITVTTGGNKQLLLTNVGTQLVFVRVRSPGEGAVNATNADLPLLANTQRIVSIDGTDMNTGATTVVSVFGTATGSTIYCTPGEGYE